MRHNKYSKYIYIYLYKIHSLVFKPRVVCKRQAPPSSFECYKFISATVTKSKQRRMVNITIHALLYIDCCRGPNNVCNTILFFSPSCIRYSESIGTNREGLKGLTLPPPMYQTQLNSLEIIRLEHFFYFHFLFFFVPSFRLKTAY